MRDRWPAGLAGDALYEDVVARYAEPHRRYHTLRHVAHVLDTADALSGGTATEAVRWAAWLHDVVYDTRAADNEERSADYARERLPALGVASEVVEDVARLVLATKTHDPAPDSDRDAAVAILLDADLAVLGADPQTYARYAAAVREEYDWVPDDLWKAGRKAVLASFLDKPSIFATPAMRARAEAAARANLAAELASLA
ncbi:MAG TPA: hypothetical protein VGX28_12180 [Frankiaceae bacterium]|nr:hypothetical protein [Frankiaceae bacterium]